MSLEKLFTNSTWIVPEETLLAYFTVNNVSKPVNDQTVWIIDSYNKGYVFGTSYTALDGKPFSKTRIVGSITPEGRVLFSFHSNNVITDGSGTFGKNKCGHREFIMQMNTLNSINDGVVGVSHWSYMIRVTPRDCEYQHLPGVGISVPEFISLFN